MTRLSLALGACLAAWLASSPALAYDDDDLRQLQFEKKCNGCDLSGANLQGMSLRGASIRWSNLSNANLNNADLEEANLTGSDLTRARLSQTRFSGATLQGVQFNNADLSSADFHSADLRWSKMEHLDIDNDLISLGLLTARMDGVRFRNDRRCAESQDGAGIGCIPDFR